MELFPLRDQDRSGFRSPKPGVSFSTRLVHCVSAMVMVILMLGQTGAVMAFQGSRGTINGVVADQNGAAVNGATVKLFDVVKKQEVRSVTTNSDGLYTFLEIEPAEYDITINAAGFAEKRITAVKVEPNRNLVIDIPLSAAGAAEEITVTASEELLDRQTPTLGTTVENTRIEGLPLNGRNVLQLALLQPGVTTIPAGTFGEGVGIRVNGQRGVENNITLDGSNNNEVAVGGTMGAQPRPDAVEEFRLLSSNPEAEFGRNTGAIINVVTQSGGTSYHGNARIFYRPTFLSAARFFDQNSPNDTPRRGDDDFRRRFERKEVGGNFSGPFWIPGLYKQRDRTFFFLDYERRAQLVGNTRTVTGLPTSAELNGDFSDLGSVIIDPSTRLPFPNNRIPESRISPIARYYLNFIPAGGSTGEATVGADDVTNNHYFTARVDHRLTSNQNLSFTFNFFDGQNDSPFPFGTGAPDESVIPGFGGVNLNTAMNIVVRHTHSLSSNMVNSLLVAYARNNLPVVTPENLTPPSDIGFTGNFVVEPSFAGPPYIWIFDRGIGFGNAIQGPQTRVTENFQLQDSVSWSSGNHRWKFGFDGTFYKDDEAFLFVNQGILGYSVFFGGNTTGDAFADFLIGNGPSFIQTGSNGERDFRQRAFAAFAQDAWRVSDSLTLSLGVRYEYTSPLTDKHNRVSYYRPGVTSQLLTSGNLRNFDGRPITVAEGGRAPNGVVFVGDPDPVLGTVPDGGVEKDWNNWAPRLGIAYSPSFQDGWLGKLVGDRQTVIRAGYGIVYGAVIGDTILQQLSAPGFSGTDFFAFTQGAGTLADPFAPDPFPAFRGNGGQLPNPFASSVLEVTAPLSFTSQPINPKIRTPYTQQWNFTIERGFLKDYVARASYVGNRGVKLYAVEELNPALGTLFPGQNIPDPEPGNVNDRRLNPDIQESIGELVSAGNSFYHALQLDVQRRFANGLSFEGAYTWSKSITETETQRGLLDRLDRSANRALSSQDVPHRLTVSWIYEFPFFRESRGITGRFLGGWALTGIATYQSGTPFTVANPFDTTGDGNAVLSFADIGAPFRHADPRKEDGRAFNADAFRAFGEPDEDGQYTVIRRGTLGRNQFRAKNGINNWDLGLIKKTRLWGESTALELRLEAFNAFNHTQFFAIDTNLLNEETFGKFISARESRIIQLGARISF